MNATREKLLENANSQNLLTKKAQFSLDMKQRPLALKDNDHKTVTSHTSEADEGSNQRAEQPNSQKS